MNSLDLTLSAIEGTPERVPFNPFIMHLAAAIEGVPYSQIYCQDAKVLAEMQIKCTSRFKIDHVCVSTDAYREASAWGVEVDFSSHTPVAKTLIFFEDFDAIESPDIATTSRIQDRVKAVRLLKEEVGNEQCVVGWIEAPFAEICCLFGLMNVLKLARSPNWNKLVKGIMERILPVQLEFAKMQVEAGADIIGAGDSAVSQIGPRRYKEACLEHTKKLFNDIDVPVLYHVCGNSSVIDSEGRDMLELVTNSGASVLDIDYQVDMKGAKEKVGKRICLRGNTNTSILGNRTYSTDYVENEIAQAIKAGKPEGKYMYAAGCEWPWEPLEYTIRNLTIARKLIDKLGVY